MSVWFPTMSLVGDPEQKANRHPPVKGLVGELEATTLGSRHVVNVS